MKKFVILCACAVLAGFVSCQKQQTEEERKAEIDRQVEQRLAAEHQAEEQQKLAQRQAELDAREKALAEKEHVAAQTPTPAPRPRVVRESASSEPAGSYNTFYTKLDRYGDWRETSDYGYVWQPREAERSRNWRPYTNGRWVYSDVGWTWVSEEPFGWATYHYGRWTRLRNIGWVWVPGDEWAPAWVSWRKSNDYVGWAPLPPEARFDRRTGIHNWSDNYYDIGPDQYSFVATAEFGAQRLEGTIVPSERNITIINLTTNVTNITYSNTTIVNQGPSYDELRTRTRQPIARLRLEREVNVDLNAEARPIVRGEVVFMPAPLIARGQAVERPRTVKAPVATVVVDRGWEGISDRQAAEKARAQMKSESTPPANAPSKIFVKPAIAPTTAESASPVVTATVPQAASPTATPVRKPTVLPTSTSSPSPSASASATVSPSASPTATPVRKPTVLPTSTSSPSPSATATVSPSAGPIGTPVRRPTLAPTSTPSPAASATARPVTRMPERKFTPAPTATPSASTAPNASPTANVPAGNATASPTPVRSMPLRPRPTPSATIVPPSGSPMATAPARSTTTPTPAPQVSPTPSDAAAAPPSPSQKGEERGTRRPGAGKPSEPGESASPTPTPSAAPE